MIDFIDFDKSLLIGILSPFLLAVGYFYRSRKENKRNRKLALYTLLEIWHRVSIFYRKDFDDAFDLVFIELRKQFPNERITEVEIEASKAHFSPLITEILRTTALSGLTGYQDKYQDVISLISEDDPIFAYKISAASKTKRFLGFLDSYFEKTLESIENGSAESQHLAETLKSHMAEHAKLDCINDLEADIKILSFKVSIYTWLSCIYTIKKRRKSLKSIENHEVEALVKNIIAPAINEFSKKTG